MIRAFDLELQLDANHTLSVFSYAQGPLVGQVLITNFDIANFGADVIELNVANAQALGHALLQAAQAADTQAHLSFAPAPPLAAHPPTPPMA